MSMHATLERVGIRWWSDWLSDGEIYLKPAFGLKWSARDYDDEANLYVGGLFFALYVKTFMPKHFRETLPTLSVCNGITYGFSFVRESGIHVHWGLDDGTPKGCHYAILDWPWNWWYHYATDKLSPVSTADYRYTLRNRETQERKATFFAERMEWRWHLFNRKRFRTSIKRVRKSIDVTFSDEVGERTGSWKGGTVGCGYTMSPGERPIDTLRRMERERSFQ